MALARILADFFARGLESGAIQPGGDLLELGESVIAPYDSALNLIAAVEEHVPAERVAEAKRQVCIAKSSKAINQSTFGPARAFYHAVFEPNFYMAVELGPAPRRLCIDMNDDPIVPRRFDYVINNGTTEHVFNQAQAYKFIHDATRPGGLMVHWTPCLGWIDHGLYNVQPGFFFDLAQANSYRIERVELLGHGGWSQLHSGDDFKAAVQHNPRLRDALACAMLRKVTDRAFEAPIQGSYQHGQSAAYVLSKVRRHYTVDGRENLALGKPSNQSSTSRYSFDEDTVKDASGGNNGVITGYYSFHTDIEPEPWWMVDLEREQPLREVVVYNVLSAAGEIAKRASRLRISLSADGTSWSTVFSRDQADPIGGADGHPLRVPLIGLTARYLKLSLPGRTVLHLDKVQVF